MPEAGLMPHPERACKLALGSDDGKWIFESVFVRSKAKLLRKRRDLR